MHIELFIKKDQKYSFYFYKTNFSSIKKILFYKNTKNTIFIFNENKNHLFNIKINNVNILKLFEYFSKYITNKI